MATLMSPSLMAWHDSLVVLRCHRHVSEDPCRCYSCVKWTSRKQQHFINYLHWDLIKRRLSSDIKRNWNELYFGRNAFPSSLLGPLQKSHLGIPTNNAPPLLSSKFTDLSCNACRNTVHFLLCRKIPFCSTDVLFPVCWGSAQPYVIYWAWLHCQCCFPTIINNYNAETSLIFIVHSLHFFSEMYFSSDSSRLGRCHIALCRVDKLFFFLVQLWNIKPVRCVWGCCLWYASVTSSPTVSLLSEETAENASFSSDFFRNKRQRAKKKPRKLDGITTR